MTANSARKWLIVSSLIITGGQMIFLLTAPAFSFPLAYPKNLELLQIVLPVFLGYLGSASHFIFQSPTAPVRVKNQFLGLLVKGPIIIYVLAVLAAFGSFSYTNRIGADSGVGMSVDNLATALSLTLGLLAVTTGIVSSYLFAIPKHVSSGP
ncbi:MAG: hypothetical protein NTZ24_13680 [Deltaproteobacteria bacterium]|nr:hypothetical protein [Deltaproteobacteria bacterium]